MTLTFRQALEHGKLTTLSTCSLTFRERGQATGHIYAGRPDSFIISASQMSVPTGEATATFHNPDFDWRRLTPNKSRLHQMSILVEVTAEDGPTQRENYVFWISDVNFVWEAGIGHVLTVTAKSADWIITNHRFNTDLRREVIDKDVDNFWYTRFQFPVTGTGLDPFFQEFVDMRSGITAATSPGPIGDVWIPAAAESTLWDVASALAGHWGRYVAGYIKIGSAPVSGSVNRPAIFLPPHALPGMQPADLRMISRRILRKETASNPAWAERIIHQRRWSEGSGAGDGAVLFDEVTAYGTPQTDLRPQIIHETWSPEENSEAMTLLVDRVKARTWVTGLTTRLDLDLWLGHPVLIEEGERFIAALVLDVLAGEMELELAEADTTVLYPGYGVTWNDALGTWDDKFIRWNNITWENR